MSESLLRRDSDAYGARSELDPRSVMVASNYGSMLLVAGRNAEAIAACKAALEYAPNSFLCTSVVGLGYLVDGQHGLRAIYYDLLAAFPGAPISDAQVKTLFDALAGHSHQPRVRAQADQVQGRVERPGQGHAVRRRRHSADPGFARRE